jgi:hypothetical protein
MYAAFGPFARSDSFDTDPLVEGDSKTATSFGDAFDEAATRALEILTDILLLVPRRMQIRGLRLGALTMLTPTRYHNHDREICYFSHV